MKNKILKVLTFGLFGLGLLALPRSAQADNNMDAMTRSFAAIQMSDIRIGSATIGGFSASTTTSIMNLYYTGTASAAYVTIETGTSSGYIQFFAPFGIPDTSIGGPQAQQTNGAFDLGASTVQTLGQLCDLINGVAGPFVLNGNANGGAPSGGNYHCVLTGGIRSDIASQVLPAVTEVINVNPLQTLGGYTVPIGTNTIISLGIIPAPGRRVVLDYCTVMTTSTVIAGVQGPPLQIFGVPAKFGLAANAVNTFGLALTDSNLAWQSQPLNSTIVTNEPLGTPVALPWLEFGGGSAFKYNAVPAGQAPQDPTGLQYNGHVVVRLNNYGAANNSESPTGANAIPPFISCVWQEK